ncbi:MAG TPA: SRPBCC family protein [Actinomycetota bacterium]|nr:SRPBCC family protein [Actinomycetota bacterium]
MTNADRDAPVFSEGQIDIAATPEDLWDIMSDFENWPSWNPDVQSVTLEGPVAEGTTFRWKAGATRLVSTLRVVERPHALGWTGRTMGIHAIHVWRFAASPEGAIARMEESFDGVVATLFRKRLQRQLDETTAKGLQLLKETAERTNSR